MPVGPLRNKTRDVRENEKRENRRAEAMLMGIVDEMD
jgi:hypothetical protein